MKFSNFQKIIFFLHSPAQYIILVIRGRILRPGAGMKKKHRASNSAVEYRPFKAGVEGSNPSWLILL